MAPTTDEALLRRFVKGDRAALGVLAERYERQLLGLALGILDGRADRACEAVQETWLRVIRFADRYRGVSTVKTWLYRIALNRCRDLRAARERLRTVDSAVIDDGTPARVAAVDEETLLRIRAELSKLSEEKREIVLLCFHAGLSREQVADVLRIPIGTVKSRLHHALQDLRERLNGALS